MGLLDELGAWLDQKKRNVAANAQDLPGLLRSFGQDVQQGAGADKSAWDASRSVMPEVREAGVREMNARGQELGGLLGAIKVFHGSPHKFDKFDFSKIGTGEGAQAYGHGGYFAENPAIAKSYQNQLAGKNADAALLEMGVSKDHLQNSISALRQFTTAAENGLPWERAAKNAQNASIGLRGLKTEDVIAGMKKYADDRKGAMYEANLRWPDAAREAADPLGPQHFLDWDKPLSEQPKAVRDALSQFSGKVKLQDGMPLSGGGKLRIESDSGFGEKYFLEMDGKRFRLAAGDVQNMVGAGVEGKSAYQNAATLLGGDAAASNALRQVGVPGIRYLDGGSRAAGQGTANYVVFDDALTEILKRNGEPVPGLLKREPTGPAMSVSQGKFDFANPGGVSRVAKIGDTEITYGVGKNGIVDVILLKTPKAKRGEGSARAAMEQLKQEADANNLRLALNAEPMDKGVTQGGLETFYKSLGFRKNTGRKADFDTTAGWVRDPAQVKPSQVSQGLLSREPTKFQLAHAEAQRNAALPVEQGGLGLGPQNTAMERAAAMGFNGDMYHGTARLDRMLEKPGLDPTRATSGPMPFFTSDPDIASNYAKGKADTSLSKMDNGNIADYFQVSPKELGYTRSRAPYTVEQSWHHLKPEQKATILDRAKRVGYENVDEATGPFTLHPPGTDASLSGSHFDYLMKTEARGNPLAALRAMWHDGGNLVGSEEELASIFKLAGYPHNISQTTAPWYEAKGILPAKIRMSNPIDTSNTEQIQGLLTGLKKDFKGDRSRTKQYGADQWDKNVKFTPREWVDTLANDVAAGHNSYVWTSIPDKVTAALKQRGYDGIIDKGGKGGSSIGHDVFIPFGPEQVRSRFAAFDPKKRDSRDLLASMGLMGLLGAGAYGNEQ